MSWEPYASMVLCSDISTHRPDHTERFQADREPRWFGSCTSSRTDWRVHAENQNRSGTEKLVCFFWANHDDNVDVSRSIPSVQGCSGGGEDMWDMIVIFRFLQPCFWPRPLSMMRLNALNVGRSPVSAFVPGVALLAGLKTASVTSAAL